MYYNITIGGERSTGTPNLYYVINGRPQIGVDLIRFIEGGHLLSSEKRAEKRKHSEGEKGKSLVKYTDYELFSWSACL